MVEIEWNVGLFAILKVARCANCAWMNTFYIYLVLLQCPQLE